MPKKISKLQSWRATRDGKVYVRGKHVGMLEKKPTNYRPYFYWEFKPKAKHQKSITANTRRDAMYLVMCRYPHPDKP